MDKQKLMKGLCAPTVLAAIFGATGLISAKNNEQRKQMLAGVITQLLILWVLCYYGYIRTAWVVLLLPVILVVLLSLGVIAAVSLGGNKSYCCGSGGASGKKPTIMY